MTEDGGRRTLRYACFADYSGQAVDGRPAFATSWLWRGRRWALRYACSAGYSGQAIGGDDGLRPL